MAACHDTKWLVCWAGEHQVGSVRLCFFICIRPLPPARPRFLSTLGTYFSLCGPPDSRTTTTRTDTTSASRVIAQFYNQGPETPVMLGDLPGRIRWRPRAPKSTSSLYSRYLALPPRHDSPYLPRKHSHAFDSLQTTPSSSSRWGLH